MTFDCLPSFFLPPLVVVPVPSARMRVEADCLRNLGLMTHMLILISNLVSKIFGLTLDWVKGILAYLSRQTVQMIKSFSLFIFLH